MARHGRHRRTLEQKLLAGTVKLGRLTPAELERYRKRAPKPPEPRPEPPVRHIIVRPDGQVLEVTRAQQIAYCCGDPDWRNAK